MDMYTSYGNMSEIQLIPVNKQTQQTVYSDGRIIIPRPLRKLFGIKKGDTVELLLIGFYKYNGGEKDEDDKRSTTQ